MKRWTPYLPGEALPAAGISGEDRPLTLFFAFVATLVTAAVAALSWLSFDVARQSVSGSPLEVVFFLAGVAALAFVNALRQAAYEDPFLDVLLVSPLSERRIYWRLWRQVLTTGMPGMLACGPAWGWLLGRGAAPWLLVPATLAVLLGLVGCAALAAMLALLGRWASNLLVIGATFSVCFMVSDDQQIAWLGAFGWPPLVAAVAALAVADVTLLGAADAAVRLIYTRRRLVRLRSPRKDETAGDEVPASSRLARRLVGHLDPAAHARWRLSLGDEQPESFIRHMPVLAVLYTAAALAGRAITVAIDPASTEAGETFGADFMALSPVLMIAIFGIVFFARPSMPLRQLLSGRSDYLRALAVRQTDVLSPMPQHEIFPVPIRAYLKTAFAGMTGVWTAMLLLSAPFAFAVVEDRRLWLWVWLWTWIAGLLLVGVSLLAAMPGIDPRRDPPWRRRNVNLGVLSLATATGGFWLLTAVFPHDERFVRFVAGARELLAGVPLAAVLAAVVVVLGGLEVWGLRHALRRYDERWFDVVP